MLILRYMLHAISTPLAALNGEVAILNGLDWNYLADWKPYIDAKNEILWMIGNEAKKLSHFNQVHIKPIIHSIFGCLSSLICLCPYANPITPKQINFKEDLEQ